MPMSYQIDLDRKMVLFTASGTLTNEEMIDCIARLNADSDLEVGMPTLTDARSVTEMKVTAEGFKVLAERMQNSETPRGASRAALLVTSEGNIMLGKLLVAYSDHDPNMPQYEVFTDQAEAESWLGLSPRPAEPD